MNKRIKEVRESVLDENGKKCSQTRFAEIMCVTRDMIATYESGRVEPSPLFISTLCSKFNISEEWLRTGNGSMKAPVTREKMIADIAKQMLYEDDSDFKSSLIELIAGMPADMIEYLKNFTLEYAEKIKEKELP